MDSNQVRSELASYLEKEFEIRSDFRNRAYDIAKLRTNFHEKLVLLSAGTLSLIATAAMTIVGKQQLADRSALEVCIVLLLAAIVSAVLSHWVTISYLIHANQRDAEVEIVERERHLRKRLNELGQAPDELYSAPKLGTYTHDREGRKRGTWVTDWVTQILSIAAILASLAAYVYLFRFLFANIPFKS